jgi:hypothetical protein
MLMQVQQVLEHGVDDGHPAHVIVPHQVAAESTQCTLVTVGRPTGAATKWF